jgi:hypothetical protein
VVGGLKRKKKKERKTIKFLHPPKYILVQWVKCSKVTVYLTVIYYFSQMGQIYQPVARQYFTNRLQCVDNYRYLANYLIERVEIIMYT